ncbi:SDR family NAD(P)-dependent oxidoreductase [Citrobacter telavivensis]
MISQRFEGKVALVTGGRSGIGRAIACRLRDEGARVFTAQRGKDEEFECISVDFSSPASVGIVVDKIIDLAGRLDILVNNAGVLQEALIEEMSLEEWNRSLNINVTTPFMLIKAAIPYLRIHSGSIVNIGSIEGIGANPKHAAYGTSKAALHGLTRSIAIDHSREGIRCNTIAPGWIETDINLDFINKRTDKEKFMCELSKIHPVGRIGTPQDIANLVSWLVSDEASFVTGQVWTVDGGRTAKLSLPE